MLVNITHDTRREHWRLLVAGVVLLTVMGVLVALSIAIYNKSFVNSTMVTVKADRAGLQLAKFGDVRVHGVLVGRVDSVEQDGNQASIRLALEPESAKNIPENVTVEIQPTTLFGQKFISLVDPAQPSARPLSDGYVIPSSRVTTTVELSEILADLFPMLRSIRPEDLSTTLTSLATALRGRGEVLGKTMTELDEYLTAMNRHLPTLRRDLTLLSRVSKTYAMATPDLVRVLRNATTTARTVGTLEQQLNGFFEGVTTLSQTGTRVLARNEKNIIREGELAVPLLRMLDTYSPGFDCLLRGTARYTDPLNEIFAAGSVAQTMALNPEQRPPYKVSDRPEYGDLGLGPKCYGLPNPELGFQGVFFNDGYEAPGE